MQFIGGMTIITGDWDVGDSFQVVKFTPEAAEVYEVVEVDDVFARIMQADASIVVR